MSCLYLLGGKQRRLLVKKEDEWNLYDSALILRLDTVTADVQPCFEHKTRSDARAHERSSSVFKSATLVDDVLYACTNTEVLVIKVPQFELIKYISLPCFNDIHHVTLARDGTLLVVNTGLDMVLRLTLEGRVLEEWSVLGEAPWQRFSREIDYRKVASTKPHQSHPNFAFELGRDVWVTRLMQRDALCLTDAGKRIDISLEAPHDGLVRGKDIHFTLVDGRLVIANADTLAVDRVFDLKAMDDANSLLGWCRGVLPLDAHRFWVGFTRVRKTEFSENVQWVKRVLREGMLEKPTHIALYDVSERRRLREFNLERYGMNIIFSILPAAA